MTNDAQEAARKKSKKASRTANPETDEAGRTNEPLVNDVTCSRGQESIGIQSSQRAGQVCARGWRNYIIDGNPGEWKMENGEPGSGKGDQTKAWKDKVSTSMEQSVGANRHRTGGSPAGVCAYGAFMGHCHGGGGRYS